jgi:ribonuclease III
VGDGPRSPDELARIIGHDFTRPELLEVALTHVSAAATAADSYERLEFLGDRVLGLVIADLLMRRHPDEKEGDLARRLAGLVARDSLVEIADAIGLGSWLRLSAGEHAAGMRDNRSVLADVMEAVIGAVYRDGGLEAAAPLVERLWAPLEARDETPPTDAKTALQELVQARGGVLPQYRVLEKMGPDHQPVFSVEVTVEGAVPARGEGTSKRAAEQAAAEALLHILQDMAGAR